MVCECQGARSQGSYRIRKTLIPFGQTIQTTPGRWLLLLPKLPTHDFEAYGDNEIHACMEYELIALKGEKDGGRMRRDWMHIGGTGGQHMKVLTSICDQCTEVELMNVEDEFPLKHALQE